MGGTLTALNRTWDVHEICPLRGKTTNWISTGRSSRRVEPESEKPSFCEFGGDAPRSLSY